MSKLQVMKGDAFSEKRLIKWLEEDGAVVVQTKRDEFRCVVEVHEARSTSNVLIGYDVTYTSASGKPLYNLGGFDSMFIDMAQHSGINKFDMGVCINDSFDLTRRTVRASKKVYDLTGDTVQVIAGDKKSDPAYYTGYLKAHFWFYDLPTVLKSYLNRRIAMASIAINFPEYTGIPETEVIDVLDEGGVGSAVARVHHIFGTVRELGHEGLMVKRYDHEWEPRRCADSWMKLKPVAELDGRIIGYTEGKGRFAGLIGSLVCQAEDSTEFRVSGMTDAEREHFTENKLNMLGLWITATYMERDSQGGYRHPQFKRMHAEKNL